ncbi:MAG: class I SAM-dependent methyltransferase [Caldilineae bacterium]|nr:MAG: class I SAM-dependent methyltransferase [Caldilineae bacterium]
MVEWRASSEEGCACRRRKRHTSAMDESIRQRLLQINREFYERFAAAFAATRYGEQAGWHRIITYFSPGCQVLDLGCGNGRFALFLSRHVPGVEYLGLDGSAALVEIARGRSDFAGTAQVRFRQEEIDRPGWDAVYQASFHVVTALAVLHHIPGHVARGELVRAASRCLRPGGVLILSNWRFLHSERMRRKLVSWSEIGLRPEDVEPGDYLLDWKKEGRGLRYVHQVEEAEVEQWAAAAGLRVLEQFHADGREGDLSLYSVLGL